MSKSMLEFRNGHVRRFFVRQSGAEFLSLVWHMLGSVRKPMKEGRCPQCESTRVFQNRMDQNSYRLTISTFHDTKLTIYACTGCGYTERYVLDENALKKIEAKWTPVTK